MKRLSPHKHVIQLLGCITETGVLNYNWLSSHTFFIHDRLVVVYRSLGLLNTSFPCCCFFLTDELLTNRLQTALAFKKKKKTRDVPAKNILAAKKIKL